MSKALAVLTVAVMSLVFAQVAAAHNKSVSNDCLGIHTTGTPAHGPNIPTVAANGGAVDVGWIDRCTNEKNYEVLRGLSADVAGMTVVGTVATNSNKFTDTTPVCGVVYYYAIQTSVPEFTSRSHVSDGVAVPCGEAAEDPIQKLPRQVVCSPLTIQLAMGDGVVFAGPGTLDLDQMQAQRLLGAGLVQEAFYVQGVGITCDDPAAKYGATQLFDAAKSPMKVNASGQDLGPNDPGRNYIYYARR